MTRAFAWNDEKRHSIHVTDHATGSEQVCAGVSALVYGLAGWLKNKDPEATVMLEDGDAYLESTAAREDVEAAFAVAIIGLLNIQEGYGEYLQVEA